MALIYCTECGNQVSDKAPACPKCGAPAEKSVPKQEHVTPKETIPKQPIKQEQKSSSKGIWYTLLVVIVGGALIAFYNNPNSIPGVTLKINTPKPVVATMRADDANATLLDYKETVYATITNQGGDGNVLVNFHLFQAGKSFIRTKSIYMSAGQNMDLSAIFDEPRRMGGDMKYSVDAQAQ